MCLDEDNALPFHCHWSWDKSEAPKVRVQNSDEDVQLCSLSLFISQSTRHFFFFCQKYAKCLAKDPPHFPGNGGLECTGGREPCGHTVSICSTTAPTRPPNQKAKTFPQPPLIKNSLGSQRVNVGKDQRAPALGICRFLLPGLAARRPSPGTRQVIPVGIHREIQQNPLLLSRSAHRGLCRVLFSVSSSRTRGVCKGISHC